MLTDESSAPAIRAPRSLWARCRRRLAGSWEVWFLEERPSVGVSLFRFAVAWTIGLHVFPTFLQMGDNYFASAFREYNPSFFPVPVLEWVSRNSDGTVSLMAGAFTASWLAFALGLFTQWSAAALQVCTYYFYARNSLHIGTLSFDILLVTMFLMLVTGYPGDSFSLDSLLRGDPDPYRRRRPIFLQRLLQLQIASTYFYTGLWKWAGGGNWIRQNPYYYLMHSPPTGVMKDFPWRQFLGARPGLCHALGLACIACEMGLPLLLFWRRTRAAAIAAGCVFQLYLLLTMHVPTIFFFLFPPQLLLFIDPERIVGRLERARERRAARGRDRLIYDGGCGFCRASLARLQALDPTGRLEPVDFRTRDAAALHRALTPEACHARLHLLERDGRLTGGFRAFRRLTLRLPMLWPLAPLMNLPGSAYLGDPVYAWVSRNRFRLLHRGAACRDNACAPLGH